MKKRIPVFLCVLLLTLLTGCGAKTIDEMYSLPRHSERNNNLRSAIESAIDRKSTRLNSSHWS